MVAVLVTSLITQPHTAPGYGGCRGLRGMNLSGNWYTDRTGSSADCKPPVTTRTDRSDRTPDRRSVGPARRSWGLLSHGLCHAPRVGPRTLGPRGQSPGAVSHGGRQQRRLSGVDRSVALGLGAESP